MYNILISGYYGFNNIGDESILRTVIDNLREKLGDVGITVLSHDPAQTSEKYGVQAAPRMELKAIFRCVRRCDLLLSGGGSLLQDATSGRSILYYLFILALAQLMGKKTFIYSQGIGPITSRRNRRLTSMILRRASGIVVRDEKSRALLLEIGVPEELIHVTADPVIRVKKPDMHVKSRTENPRRRENRGSALAGEVFFVENGRQHRTVLCPVRTSFICAHSEVTLGMDFNPKFCRRWKL